MSLFSLWEPFGWVLPGNPSGTTNERASNPPDLRKRRRAQRAQRAKRHGPGERGPKSEALRPGVQAVAWRHGVQFLFKLARDAGNETWNAAKPSNLWFPFLIFSFPHSLLSTSKN